MYDGVYEIRRVFKRRTGGIQNKSHSLPANPFPADNIRPVHARIAGVPRDHEHAAVADVLFRAGQPDGEVRPAARQLHVLLFAVQRGRKPERHQRGDQPNKEHEIY